MADGLGYTRVAPPDLRRERRHGLLSVALPVPTALEDVLNGIRYQVDCGAETRLDYQSCGDLAPEDPTDTLTQVLGDPVTVTAEDICWYGYTTAQRRARVLSKLARLEERDFAAALAAGGMVQSFATQVDVPVLADAPVSLDCALGIADHFADMRGLPITAYAPDTTSGAWRANQLTDQGGRLFTLGGTAVALVPFIGETPPDGSTVTAPSWMWLTGPLRIHWADPVISHDSVYRQNQYIMRASRSAVLDWSCAIAAIPLEYDCEAEEA